MTTMSLPVERIAEKANEVDLRKVLLTILVALPYALGWVARKVWLLVAFLGVAVAVGWREAGSPRRPQDGSDA